MFSAENYFTFLENISNIARDRALNAKQEKFIKDNIPFLFGRKRSEVKDFFDSLEGFLEDLRIIALTSEFEKHFFDKYKNAIGESRKVLKKEYPETGALRFGVDSFIKESKSFNLAEIKDIVSSRLDKERNDELAGLIDTRNWLAHGKRYERPEKVVDMKNAKEVIEEVSAIAKIDASYLEGDKV